MSLNRSLIAPTSNPLLERALIEKLQHQLEIPGDEAMDIVKVMVIKNRG